MKNLNNEESSDFEKSWNDAFEGAELEPSEDVWLKIDGVLANQEAKGFRKTIVYYKYAAAVSFLLLMSTALLSYYLLNSNEDSAPNIAENTSGKTESVEKTHTENGLLIPQDNIKEDETSAGIAKNDSHNPEPQENFENSNSSFNPNVNDKSENYHSETSKSSGLIAETNSNENDEIEDDKGNSVRSNKEKGKKQNIEQLAELNKINEAERRSDTDHVKQNLVSHKEAAASNIKDSENIKIEENNDRGLNNQYYLSPLTSKNQQLLVIDKNPIQHEIYKVPVVPIKNKKKIKEDDESLGYFAGLQFSPGYFDPNIQMNSGGSVSSSEFLNSDRSVNYSPALANLNNNAEVQPQVSYTYGLNFGFKVAKRWLINMGLQYSKNNTSGATSYVLTSDNNKRYLATPTTLNNFSNEAANDIVSGNSNLPMTFNRSYSEVYEFTSLPVKAGFVIVDKKLTWIISTGIATDFFIQSKSHDPSGSFEDMTVKSGESTEFRKMFFNGLGSSEVIYNLNKNYSISLEPSFRAAISSFSKTESLISSHPRSFGIAAGFKYNF